MVDQKCIFAFLAVTFALISESGGTFTCNRPTTPCTNNGQCVNGGCFCRNGASGKQCEIPGNVKIKGGVCAAFDHCKQGLCFDDGVDSHCDCPDGFYGSQCELPMVDVQCDFKKMWINLLPYGFLQMQPWSRPAPLTGVNFTCALDQLDKFYARNPGFHNTEWRGYAGVFPHQGDTCAGDPLVLNENRTHIQYGRIVYVSYGTTGPDSTDQTLRLTCDVKKPPPPPMPPTPPMPVLPPPSVRISFKDQSGYVYNQAIRLGATLFVHFNLNKPNQGHYNDIRIHSCHIWDTPTRIELAAVDAGCPILPVGEGLYKRAPGEAVLKMKVYRYDTMRGRLRFKCNVKVCRTGDAICNAQAICDPHKSHATGQAHKHYYKAHQQQSPPGPGYPPQQGMPPQNMARPGQPYQHQHPAPPQQRYPPPPQGGYQPQQPPPQGGYQPQQPPPQGGYSPQQPPPQGGYPPQQPPQGSYNSPPPYRPPGPPQQGYPNQAASPQQYRQQNQYQQPPPQQQWGGPQVPPPGPQPGPPQPGPPQPGPPQPGPPQLGPAPARGKRSAAVTAAAAKRMDEDIVITVEADLGML